MKNTVFALMITSLVFVFLAACAEKNPTKEFKDDGPIFTATSMQTATVFQSHSVTEIVTHTASPTRTATRSETPTASGTITRTSTVTRTATATRTNTPIVIGIYAGANIGCYDTYISKNEAGNNYGGCGTMMILANQPGTDVQRGIVRFGVASNLSSVPANALAVNIILILNAATSALGSGTIEAYKLTQPFVEGRFCDASSSTTASWSNAGASAWTTAGGSYDTTMLGYVTFTDLMPAGTIIKIPIPLSAVQDWWSNDASNYGVILKLSNETPVSGAGASFYAGAVPYTAGGTGLQIVYYP
jgi:hypothetical protein